MSAGPGRPQDAALCPVPVAAGRARRGARTAAWAIPAAIALALAAHRSAATPVWRDEYATSAHAALDVAGLIDAVARVDAVFGPYYLLMHALAPVLGGDGPWLRLPSIVAFVVATALVAVLAMRWWGMLPALAAGIAFAVNPALLAQAANARPYTLSVMFLLAAVLGIEVALGGFGRRAAWVAAAVAGALATAMHLFAVIALATTAVLLIGRRRAIGAWLLAAVPAVAVAVVIGSAGTGQRGQLTWLSRPDAREAIGILADAAGVATGRAVVFDAVLLAVLVAVLVLALFVTARSRESAADESGSRHGRWDAARPVLFSGALLVAPWLLLSIGSWLVAPMLTDRYVVWSVAGGAFVIGAGVHVWARLRTPASIAAGILSVALLVVSSGLALERIVRLEPHAGALERVVERLRSEAEPGDRIALVQRYWEGGVASEFAAASRDASYAAEVIARLPDDGQPFIEVRRVASVDPLRTVPASAAPADGDVVWLLTIFPLTDDDLEAIDPRLAECLHDVPPLETEEIDAFHLTRVACGGT